ncbi:MAG: DJ-1/PfpI family protein [Tissierellia bacterium]|nr:DJ-1/PfpI family protein [Tissierellia bacterium]
MKKIAVLLAIGFEEIEALTVVDLARRTDALEADIISTTDNIIVKGAHDIAVTCDFKLNELEIEDYDAVIIPGGMPGSINLRDNDEVIRFVSHMNSNKKIVASICAGPIVLEKAGIIDNKRITAYPGFENELSGNYQEDDVVIDGNIITGKGPAFAMSFALEMIRVLIGEQKTNNIKSELLLK